MTGSASGTLDSWKSISPSSTTSVVTQAQPEKGGAACEPIDAPARSVTVESHSRFLHVVEQGAVLRRQGTRIRISKKDSVLLDVPATKLQGVLIYGNAQVSTQCLKNLLEEGVWLSFLTRNGVYKGRLQPPAERGGRLRLMQWSRSQDQEFCLAFGKAVVRGKVLGQKLVQKLYSKNYLAETLGESHKILNETLDRIDKVAALDELRGVEGTAARAYFDLFRRWNRSDMPFEGRSKRGAVDPINALLNFGYTLLTRELEGLIEAAGLDPTVGFYHLPDNDRPSLACDWVEDFRHPVVDRLVLRLVNRGTITAEDFKMHEERGLRMTTEGMRKFLKAYEKVMSYPDGKASEDDAAGFRSIFLKQLASLLDALNARGQFRSHLEE
jgi:CRISPR-associated protein Cas1